MFQELKVIDLSTVLAGPSVATFFAELGASVTKIEHPRNPDVTRSWKLPSESTSSKSSAYFASVNYKKTIVSLDLLVENEFETCLQLIREADVLITNFKLGDAEKFGLTDDFLSHMNPQLIHGKISGFGENNDRVAYDLILQAETGFLSMNGSSDSGPVKIPVALIDVLAAHQLKEGILIALLNREKTKIGGVVSVSLYDAAICSLANQASNYLMENHIAQPIGTLHPNIAPYGELFRTLDNIEIVFAIGSSKHFSELCLYLNEERLVNDERFSNNHQRVINRKELQLILAQPISKINSTELALAMRKRFIPMGIIQNLEAVFNQQEAQALVRTSENEGVVEKRVTQIAFKLKLHGN